MDGFKLRRMSGQREFDRAVRTLNAVVDKGNEKLLRYSTVVQF